MIGQDSHDYPFVSRSTVTAPAAVPGPIGVTNSSDVGVGF